MANRIKFILTYLHLPTSPTRWLPKHTRWWYNWCNMTLKSLKSNSFLSRNFCVEHKITKWPMHKPTFVFLFTEAFRICEQKNKRTFMHGPFCYFVFIHHKQTHTLYVHVANMLECYVRKPLGIADPHFCIRIGH
jgi:hypothetical protein